MTGGESCRFFDTGNEFGHKNCLVRQVLEYLQVKWSEKGHFGKIYDFIVEERIFFFISENGIV